MEGTLQVGDPIRFRYLPLTAPEQVIGGTVTEGPWIDDDGTWLNILDEYGVTRTARIEEVVS